MTMLTWLPSVLRAEGLGVIEMPGWATRQSRTGYDPAGIVCHHTASSKAASDDSVRRLLRDGRSDLKGPLCQLGLERDGTFIVIAAGRGNHNGYGTWGNDSIGIEAYNDGVGELWPAAQLDAYHRGVAAICRRMGWSIAQVRGHKETDPGRKIDPTLDMDDFRAAVASLLSPKPPAPKPPPEEDDVFTYEFPKGSTTMLVLVHDGKQVLLTGQDLLARRRKALSHLVVQQDEADRFLAAYGPVG